MNQKESSIFCASRITIKDKSWIWLCACLGEQVENNMSKLSASAFKRVAQSAKSMGGLISTEISSILDESFGTNRRYGLWGLWNGSMKRKKRLARNVNSYGENQFYAIEINGL